MRRIQELSYYVTSYRRRRWSPFANGCYRNARAVPEDDLLSGFHPRTTGSFLCVPKARNRKKGHPGLPCREAPMPRVQGRTGGACAPKTGVPALIGRLRRFAQGTGPCAWGERGLAALRSPCSCLQVRGSPSVASPFCGTKVHRTFVLIRFTHAPPLRACPSLSLLPRLE